MCACGSSYGPDRYGPIYHGRYAFLGAKPARTPWTEQPDTKVDPSCPGCRLGAYAAGEAAPPVPFDQNYVMQQLANVQFPQLQVAPPMLQPQPAFAYPMQMVPVRRLT